MSDPNTVWRSELLVSISVSEPTDEELINLGLSELHVRHAFTEIVRHVLAARMVGCLWRRLPAAWLHHGTP